MPGLLMLTTVESGSLVLTHQTLIRLRISPLVPPSVRCHLAKPCWDPEIP